jgi:hypothetical protein
MMKTHPEIGRRARAVPPMAPGPMTVLLRWAGVSLSEIGGDRNPPSTPAGRLLCP